MWFTTLGKERNCPPRPSQAWTPQAQWWPLVLFTTVLLLSGACAANDARPYVYKSTSSSIGTATYAKTIAYCDFGVRTTSHGCSSSILAPS
jgi:hypothetical protein